MNSEMKDSTAGQDERKVFFIERLPAPKPICSWEEVEVTFNAEGDILARVMIRPEKAMLYNTITVYGVEAEGETLLVGELSLEESDSRWYREITRDRHLTGEM